MITTKIIANDLIKRPSESKQLTARLLDKYNNPMGSEVVTFTINGQSYNRDTDVNGYASLNINLPLGTYTCNIRFNTVHVYSGSTATVTVKVVERYPTKIIAEDLTKNREEAGKVTAQVLLYNGEPVRNRGILFRINGVSYTRTTDSNGYASLNIRLPRGTYLCEIFNPYDDYYEYSSTSVFVNVISSTHMDGTNIFKMEDETAVYQCAVYDELGRVQCNVTLTVNGVTYTRHTEEDGLVKLNIRLPAGEYDIVAEFHGDSSHTGSKVVNHISSKPYMEGLTKYNQGVFIPGDNTGFMESHVQVKQWSPEVVEQLDGVVFWDDVGQKFHKDISFTLYEIIETDPRVKTAKFTTREYFDLTDGEMWVYISSPYHENFGGRILEVDFNKDDGLYTYQCQDGRRNYMSKYRSVHDNISVYDVLKQLIAIPLNSYDGTLDGLNNLGGRGAKLLSGLRPLESYYLQNGVLEENWYEHTVSELLSYDSTMDKIMTYAHEGGCPSDVYFNPEGICQIEPLDINTWIKTGFKITHSDLTNYNYGFDTTNIMTGVNFQTTDNNTPIVNPDTGKTINEELQKLGFYFGANIGMISPVTESVTTETTTTSTSGGTSTGTGVNNKGKTVVVACDINNGNDSAMLGSVCSKLESAGYDVINLGIGPGYFSSYDYSGSASGKVGVYIMAASTVSVADAMSHQGFDYLVFGIRGDIEGSRAVSGWDSVAWGQDSDCTSVCNAWSGNTAQQISEKMGDRGCLVPGSSPEEMANAVLAAVNGEAIGGGGTTTTTTQQINVAESYKKAQDEVVKSGRELLSFEVKLPLNNTMFKNLHTNQMLFTELPKDFKLGNLAELFKILPTYKINRGTGTEYQENRWYIEKIVTRCDSKGLFATLTLNVLPSPYSAYTEKLRSYHDAYNQAFKQQTNTNNSSSGSSAGLRWSTGVSELDNLISTAIAGKDNDWDKAIAIHNGLRDAGIKYRYYYDWECYTTAERWNAKDNPGLNCGDTAALTAEAMKAGGLDAYVSLCPGHYITIINLYDEYAVSDLTWSSGNYSQREFNDSYGGARCRNPVDYPY